MKLNASRRELLGKRARRLLREGKVPAVVYGHHAAATSVTLDEREFEQVFKRAGHTQLVDLAVDGGRAHKVLIKDIQVHPRRHGPIHVDLHQVSMREKLQAQVPIVVVGHSPAVERGDADVLQVMHQLRVECLPGDIPEAITIDISGLENVGDGLRVADAPGFDGVTVLDDPEDVIVKVPARRELVEEEEEEEAAEGEAAAESAEEEPPTSEDSDSGPRDEAESKAEDEGEG